MEDKGFVVVSPWLLARIAAIDVHRITPQTVSDLFGWCPKWWARVILNTGVRQGVFRKIEPDLYELVQSEESC